MASEYNLTWLNFSNQIGFDNLIKQEMAKIGIGVYAQNHMADKGSFLIFRAENLKAPAANILKQEVLAKGAEVAIHPLVVVAGVTYSSVIIMATERQYKLICGKLKLQQFGLPSLAEEILAAIANLKIDKWQLALGQSSQMVKKQQIQLGGKTLIMGILNLTPDSFSDGGSYDSVEAAIAAAKLMVAEGADIIDIGGESTRPNYQPVTIEEEIGRVVPVIKGIKAALAVPVSIDTYKPLVAKAALAAGADILNDIWGLQAPDDVDHEMAKIAGEFKVPVVVMHNQLNLEYGNKNPYYAANPDFGIQGDLVGDVTCFFRKSLEIGKAMGMTADQFIFDIGFGFGKDYLQNLEILQKTAALRILGRPVLIGTSRKSTIGKLTGKEVQDREFGTGATVALGIQSGAAIVRVHNVAAMADVVRVADGILGKADLWLK